MKEYLSWHGFEVSGLNSSAQVFDELIKGSYDLLLYNMTIERSRFQICRKLRGSSDQKLNSIGILIFAPEPPEFDDYIALRQLGLYFVNKYADIEEWIQKIGLILRKKPAS